MISLATVFLVTLAAFLLVIGGMAVGVMVGRREISGSCGGLASNTDDSGKSACSLCSDPDAACRELLRRGRGTSENEVAENSATGDCALDCVAEGCSKEAIDACNRG